MRSWANLIFLPHSKLQAALKETCEEYSALIGSIHTLSEPEITAARKTEQKLINRIWFLNLRIDPFFVS